VGFCLEPKGAISTEARRESFIVHIDDRADPSYGRQHEHGDPHPEYMWEDLEDLIGALRELRMYALERGYTIRRAPAFVSPEDLEDESFAGIGKGNEGQATPDGHPS
jgi:hypothetical protein